MNYTRRDMLRNSAAAGLVFAGSSVSGQVPRAEISPDFQIVHGRIRQSVMGWCFKPMPTVELARHCKAIGLVAVEGIPSDDYAAVRDLGLQISLVGSHGFTTGPVSRENHSTVRQALLKAIDIAADVGCRNVITFTGMRQAGQSDAQSEQNCVDSWKQVIGHAEEKGVTLCLEHLNSRDDSHPMKGHPGYFGDDVERCVDLIRRVDSPNMKLLFDIYHVQIMHGDVIRRIRQYHELIGHYHTAGNPGRGELDETQEINYPAVMRTILETGYTGYVAQEFIPTWSDPVFALRHAAAVCDV